MSDLTGIFNQICTSSLSESNYTTPSSIKPKRRIFNDTFQDECYSLKKHLKELEKLIKDIHPLYLSNNKQLMSNMEIKQFDDDVKIQLKDFTNKYSFLNQYELKRYNTLTENKANFKLNNFINKAKQRIINNQEKDNSKNGTYEEQVFLSNYRQGCLAFLNLKIVEISEMFADLQKEKFFKEQKLNDLDFNMIHEQIKNNNYSNNDTYSRSQSSLLEDAAVENIDKVTYTTGYNTNNEARENEAIEYQETLQKLTQDQVQELQVENDNILHEKDHQLNELNEISTKLFEISSLTNELNLQLSQQSQNINLILDNQDSINLELKQANRQLNSKSGKMNFSAIMVSYMAIIIGIIILFLDYIN